jgi:hypothetical protein
MAPEIQWSVVERQSGSGNDVQEAPSLGLGYNGGTEGGQSRTFASWSALSVQSVGSMYSCCLINPVALLPWVTRFSRRHLNKIETLEMTFHRYPAKLDRKYTQGTVSRVAPQPKRDVCHCEQGERELKIPS